MEEQEQGLDQEQQNKSDSFVKQQKNKGKDLAKDEAKKRAKNKIMSVIMKNPKVALIVLGVIAAFILIIILFAGFLYLLNYLDEKEASEAKQASISFNLSGKSETIQTGEAGASDATEGTRLTIQKTDNGNYEIVNNYTEEELENLENNRDPNVDISDFSDFEKTVLYAFQENGLVLDDYTREELKCIPTFLKAEGCTQYLDLRKNSEKFDGSGNYQPELLEDLEENEIPGVILVQRTNTRETAPTVLEYMAESEFNELLEDDNKKEDTRNYFTIDKDGNLIISKWDHEKVTVSGFPQELPEEEKVESKDQYYITTTTIPYSQYVKKYTMPFDFLMQLLIITENPEFCLQVADIVLGSKIIINVQEEETITTTIENRTYDMHNKEEKYINYEIEPDIETKTDYFINLVKDDENNECTTYKNEKKDVKITTVYTSHSYKFEILEADTWVAHYKKIYAKQEAEISPENTTRMDVKGEYEEGEEVTITDSSSILADSHAKEFKEDKEKNYKDKIPTPNVYVSTEQRGVINSKTYKVISITPSGKFTTNLSTFEYEGQEVTNEDGTVSIIYNMQPSFNVTTIKTDEIPAQISFTYGLNNNYTYSLLSNTKDSIKCNISRLRIVPFNKINLINNISTNITKYPSDPNPITNTHIYAKDDNGNFEKFLLAYDKNKDESYMEESWLFEMMEENQNTIDLIDTIKYLLYIYDGRNRGVTDLNFEGYLNSISLAGSYSSVGNISAFGCTMERDEFISLAKNYKKNDSTYQSKMANYAGDFYDVCTKYGVNPIITYAHACLETGYGGSIPYNNYFGMAVYNGQNSGAKYNSPAESIDGYCKWVINNGSVGTSAYAENLKTATKWAVYNENLAGTPDTNIYVLYCRYAYLGDKHLCNEPDFNNPKGTSYYLSNGSTWGAGGRVYIYEMYEKGGLYTGRYKELCGHRNANDPTTDQEQADYTVYTTNKRINIAKDIFGVNIFSGYGNGAIAEQILNAAEKIRKHCTDNNYRYDVTVPNYSEGVKALWNKRGVCCASYVAWVLAEVGYEDLVNGCYFRGATDLGNKLKTVFPIVPSYDQMQPGDIIVWPNHHIQIYAGNGYWYNGGSKNPTVKYSKYDARTVFAHYGSYYILRPQ